MPAAGRVLEVDAERLPGWVRRFAERHGGVDVSLSPSRTTVVVSAPDGARADLAVPYGALPAGDIDRLDALAALVEHLRAPRTTGVVLVRRGGWAAGVVEAGALTAAATGGGYVQGSTKAGGWSQQRYARRRGHQTQRVWDRAADGAAEVLLTARDRLDALVTGGERAGVTAVLADPRLTWLPPAEPRLLDVPDPRRAVLDDVVARLTAVAITLNALA